MAPAKNHVGVEPSTQCFCHIFPSAFPWKKMAQVKNRCHVVPHRSRWYIARKNSWKPPNIHLNFENISFHPYLSILNHIHIYIYIYYINYIYIYHMYVYMAMEYIYIYISYVYMYPYTKPPELSPVLSLSLRVFRSRTEALLRYCRTSRLRRLRASFMARSSARVLEILETAEPGTTRREFGRFQRGFHGEMCFSCFFMGYTW